MNARALDYLAKERLDADALRRAVHNAVATAFSDEK
jgi:hypothetical protein